MTLEKQKDISAQVVLRPKNGKPKFCLWQFELFIRHLSGEAIITAETINEFTPSPETVTSAMTAFTNAGFEVGPAIGISFSITAPVSTFEDVFNARFSETEAAGIEVIKNDGSGGYELPLDKETVAFTIQYSCGFETFC